jgi:hypothetical protein
MCLSVSRLFWILSLAYPNLLGTKGYVVVVSSLCRLCLVPTFPMHFMYCAQGFVLATTLTIQGIVFAFLPFLFIV